MDELVRTAWGRALIAIVVAVGVVSAWLAAFRYFRDELQLEFLAWPAGVVFAILGYLLVGLAFRRGGRKAAPTKLTRAALEKHTERLLNGLPNFQYRVHPIGSGGAAWPKAIVGATGVYVVSPVVLPGSLAANDQGEPVIGGRNATDVVFAEARRVRTSVVGLLDSYDIGLPVTGLTVVDNSVFIPANLAGHASVGLLRIVRIDEIPGTIAQGPAAPPERVQEAYEALQRWRPSR